MQADPVVFSANLPTAVTYDEDTLVFSVEKCSDA